ncbi:MAG: hypothetical protein HY056_01205 [Proteobacteria bacterium]|nr:hypothetical protein [Pseudomonadota bacterium]
MQIVWEVASRFRLFRDEKDFQRHVAAMRGSTVLGAEQALALASDGRGWARDIVTRLCVDAGGRLQEQCLRDGVQENYLNPTEHRIAVRLIGRVADAACMWIFDDGDEKSRSIRAPCTESVNLSVRHGRTTVVLVEASNADGTTRRATTDIAVRDLLIAGLGDSVAAGEGNPDRPVSLSDEGFCFRQIGGFRSEYYRPGRVGFSGNKACEVAPAANEDGVLWEKLSARWMSAACHRSLYGYQLRAALALAVRSPHVAVTFLPLACTGATIGAGMLASQTAREYFCGDDNCPSSLPAQVGELRAMVERARRRDATRALDLVLVTIGANDIDFSGLVADVIIEARTERLLFSRTGVISSVEAAQRTLDRQLPRDFARLRSALTPLLGGTLERVVFVSYGNPALAGGARACPGGRDGFDVHPAFAADGERMRRVASFVQDRFLPRLKALATCTGEAKCAGAQAEAMTFVDTHQAAFAEHGVCARAESDPPFDRECFSASGESFETSAAEAASAPLRCSQPASAFRAYAPRARWIRTANDSYFTAMTFPKGWSPSGQLPSDIHDATWGILSAVYGGAIHPTAEGHAAMADAAIPDMRRLLGLAQTEMPVVAEPLPAPSAGQ